MATTAAEKTATTAPEKVEVVVAHTPPVAQTSIAVRGTHPDEVTVQFLRWTAVGLTAYQRGQFAGFPSAVALRLEKDRGVLIDPAFTRRVAGTMVRK